MKKAVSYLFKLYTGIPYIFFAAFLLFIIVSYIIDGNININDRFFDSIFLKSLIIACVAGIFIFPLVALTVLLYNKRRWTKLIYPLCSYSLYIASVVVAGHMGWWTD